jgi:type IV pilus assembly protein PilA
LSKIHNTKKQLQNQGGFTLIELLVVIGILAILLAITLIAINPNKHFEDVRNTQRESNVSAILDGIYEYEAANTGKEPVSVQGVTSTPQDIGSGTGMVNVCSDLVPTYIAALPTDPSASTGTACSGIFDSGYTISQLSGRFTIAAPAAEDGATISVTR